MFTTIILLRQVLSFLRDLRDNTARMFQLVTENQATISRQVQAVGETQDAQQKQLDRMETALNALLAASIENLADHIEFEYDLEGKITQGENYPPMTNSQQVTAHIKPVDAKGNPAGVDGVPVWASSDETIATVVAAEDGLSAVVTAVGPTGECDISVTADADLGAGVKSIFGKGHLVITPGEAVGIEITFDTPVDQGSTGGTPTP